MRFFKNPFPTISWMQEFVLPILVTMAGVYLGLWASEWEDDRKDRQLRSQALRQIRLELRENQQSLANSYRYHRRMADSMQHWQAAHIPFNEQIRRGQPFFKGLNPARLQDAAYTSMMGSDASRLLDFDLSLSINRVYRYQRGLDIYNQQVMEQLVAQLMRETNPTPGLIHRIFGFYLPDVVRVEASLGTHYRQVQTRLEAALK